MRSLEDLGYEDNLVYLRQVVLTAVMAAAFYVHQKRSKTQFILSQLHHMNEKSIGEVLDEVDEPILVVK